MNDVTAERRPVGARLMWSMRAYGWIVAACALAMAAATFFVAPAGSTYESTALVVARELNVDREILPRLGKAVFGAGAVETAVRADPALAGVTDDVIPERLSLIAAEDSVVFVVEARDPRPTNAARLANLGAAAFAEQLNRGGAGVGEFAVQAQAVVPSRPLPALSRQLLVASGALAGLILGFGLVLLVAAVRRPVVTSHDVEGAVGVPLLGVLHLPPGAPTASTGRLKARGLATVTRWLSTVPPGRMVLISPPSAAGLRQRVFVMVAVALGMLRSLRLEAPRTLVEDVSTFREARASAGAELTPRPPETDDLVLVDGDARMGIVDPAVTTLSVVAVAPRGLPRRRLRKLAADYVGGDLVGVVLVDIRSEPFRPGRRGLEMATRPARVGSRTTPAAVRELPAAEPT